MELAVAAEAVVRQAKAEGLTLQPSDNSAGYHGVKFDRGKANPFKARVWRAGKDVNLGVFATAEEAALAYARTPEAQAEVACGANGRHSHRHRPKPMALTAEEAVAQATAEGLTLEPSSNAAGYRGVCYIEDSSRYQAYVQRSGKQVYLGSFVTTQEAALAVARADARTDPPASSPRPAAAKRVTLPQKPPPAKVNPKAKSNSEEPTVASNPASASTVSVQLDVGQSVEACFGGR
eukprot:scaffold61869_cov65-Phaeocystis_antarctica.AAC.1